VKLARAAFVLCTFAACGGAVAGQSNESGAHVIADGGHPDGSDAAGDAAADDGDSSGDVLTHCAGTHDVLFVDIEGAQGALQLGQRTFTDGNANFSVTFPPLTVQVTTGPTSATAAGGTIDIYTSSNALPAVGTYSVGASAPKAGPWLGLAFDGLGCNLVSGTFTVVDLQRFMTDIASLVVSFDVECAGYGSNDSVRGCLRYQ
jgi:hypothetical protein